MRVKKNKSKLKYSLPILISRCVTLFMALAAVGFGFSVLIGWYAHITPLVRYQPDTVAIVYNTALSFILLGIGVLALIYNRSYVTLTAGILVLVISVLSLSQHVFGIHLGIDQLFFTHYDTIANAYPGRMASNTAVSFIFIAIALFLITHRRFIKSRLQKLYLAFSGGLGILTLSLAIVFVSGYFSEVQKAYAWGTITPMALNTAIGFILLSISTIALAWFKGLTHKINITKALPVIIALCIFVATILLSQEIDQQHILLNNNSSNISIAVFIIGTLLAILFGLVLRFAQVAHTSAQVAQHSLSLIRATLESTADGILVTSTRGKIVDYNKRFLKMWRIHPDEIKRYNWKKLISVMSQQLNDKEKFLTKLNDLSKHATKESLVALKLKKGFSFEQYAKPQLLNGKVIGRVWSYRDISPEKNLEKQLLRQATYDTLTELPNKALSLDLMQRLFETAKQGNKSVAVLLVDIDRFTQINDAFGHSKGDSLLRLTAARFKEHLPTDVVVGRLGGDEFLILSHHLQKAEDVTSIVHQLIKSLEKPFDFYGQPLNITCCIGIAFYPKDGQDTDVLLGNAEVAMVRAKKEGYKTFQFYTRDMNVYAMQHLKLETQLQEALERQQFQLCYQPIFRLNNLKPTGVEALIRWQHPDQGVVYPTDFIPLAEETGLIDQIGEWVLTTACHQVKKWQEQGFDKLKVAVNVSARQFSHGLLTQAVVDALSQTQIDPKSLELELTESVLIGTSEEVNNTLNELQDIGVHIAIDDFGTGYSSLSYLRQFRVGKLKIDRSFILGLTENQEDKTIVQTIIAIANTLGMKVVAEGIETEKQLKLLTKLDCNYGQGYYFTHPLPVKECTEFLKKHQSKPKKPLTVS